MSRKTTKQTGQVVQKEDILKTIEEFPAPLLATKPQGLPTTGASSNNHGEMEIIHDIPDNERSSSLSMSYSEEWLKLKQCQLSAMKSLALTGKLRATRFRSVYWRVFLGCFPANASWVESTHAQRKEYETLKEQVLTNPRRAEANAEANLALFNPLSQDDQSPWHQFFQDRELRTIIQQDVARTFPEIEFFQLEQMREYMLSILFCYVKTRDEHEYRQGMHEILAPILFVLHCDHQAYLHAVEVESVRLFRYLGQVDSDEVAILLDQRYIEHDAYTIFKRIMATISPWYYAQETVPVPIDKKKTLTEAVPFQKVPEQPCASEINHKLNHLYHELLVKHDHDLYQHLEQLAVAPQVYGIRWLRLLFGREFPLQDLLVLWDALFADGIHLDLVDFVFVALLIFIRDLLLAGDESHCLRTVLNYPSVPDVQHFIDRALYLRNPMQVPRPPNLTYGMLQQNSNGRSSGPTSHSGLSTRSSAPAHAHAPAHAPPSPPSHQRSAASRPQARQQPDSKDGKDNKPQRKLFPGKGKRVGSPHVAREMAQLDAPLHEESDMAAMRQYCATKLDVHLERLQRHIIDLKLDQNDDITLAIAGFKQVRDILKGGLTFVNNSELDAAALLSQSQAHVAAPPPPKVTVAEDPPQDQGHGHAEGQSAAGNGHEHVPPDSIDFLVDCEDLSLDADYGGAKLELQ